MLKNLYIDQDHLHLLAPVFQKGVRIETDDGLSLSSLLRDRIGISPELEKRIGTLFLNGKPVDDMDTAIVRDGAVLALSSAMPGLVGAAMRRSGALASLRSGISRHDKEDAQIKSDTPGKAAVLIKLFNTMIKDAGPPLLRYGFYAEAKDLSRILEDLRYGDDKDANVFFFVQEEGS